MLQKNNRRKRLNASQTIVLGFIAMILLGALLLMLPISSASGETTPFLDALFTATTSTCVTGLVVVDTGTHWSAFGQALILVLMQIGGLGVVTVAASFAILSGKKLGLRYRSTMQEAVAAPQVGGIVRLTGFILKTTFLIEGIGAVLLMPVFCKDFGLRGIWMAVFQSVSTFCNAGLDLMGVREPFSSMTSYAFHPAVNLILIGMILAGGIGFLTWDDLRIHKFRFRKYRMQTKAVLVCSLGLILLPALWFFFMEYGELPLGKRVMASLFQTISPRTAGMNTTNLAEISQSGQLLTIGLMLVGGSSGSTAGGMKITTFAVLVACAVSVFRKREHAQMFGRRISHDVVATVATLFLLYIGLTLGGAMVISAIEALPLLTCWYETTSAMATVGLTLGITPALSSVSHCILILLMFLGRVGGLTLIYAAWSEQRQPGKLPLDKIMVG